MPCSGLITLEEAVALYESFPAALHAGTLHPRYVQADALRDATARPCFWRFDDGGERYLHSFLLSSIQGTGWNDIQSPYGYGGPVATTGRPEFIALAEAHYVAWARERRVVAEFIRFHPLLDNWRFYGGESFTDRETVWLALDRDDPLAGYEVRQRTAVRKAIKSGVEACWLNGEEMLALFPGIYRQAMADIGAENFYFFNDAYFEALLGLPFACGCIALRNNEPVAGAVFLDFGLGEYHLSGKTLEGAKVSATTLLIHEAAQRLRDAGLARLHLGGGTTREAADPLLFFKAGFSPRRAVFRIGRRICLPEVYEELKVRFAEDYMLRPGRVLFYRP